MLSGLTDENQSVWRKPMFPEYNTQLQSAESCISQLFHSKTSTFRPERVSKSCNNTMPFHQPVSDHEMLFFSQTLKSTEQATKRRRGQWPPGDDSPGCCLVFNRSSLYKKVGPNCWSCRTYRQEPNKKRQRAFFATTEREDAGRTGNWPSQKLKNHTKSNRPEEERRPKTLKTANSLGIHTTLAQKSATAKQFLPEVLVLYFGSTIE